MKRYQDIVLIGGGGHCSAVIDVIERDNNFSIAGIVDKQEQVGTNVLGYPIFATDEELSRLVEKYRHFIITVGHLNSNVTRVRLFDLTLSLGGVFPVIASPRACISKHASIGEGSIMMHQSVVNAKASVGKNVIVNTGAVIEHDSVIGNHCHISTGAYVNGCCKVEDNVFIGSNAVIKQGVNIGKNAVIGAGSVVISDVKHDGVYAGNPAVFKHNVQ